MHLISSKRDDDDSELIVRRRLRNGHRNCHSASRAVAAKSSPVVMCHRRRRRRRRFHDHEPSFERRRRRRRAGHSSSADCWISSPNRRELTSNFDPLRGFRFGFFLSSLAPFDPIRSQPSPPQGRAGGRQPRVRRTRAPGAVTERHSVRSRSAGREFVCLLRAGKL